MSSSPASVDVANAAQSLDGDVVELRRAIHKEPEIGLDLPDTQAKILEALTGLGLDVTLGESLSSVVADLDTGKPGPTVLLRGDMDALPMQEDNDLAYRSKREGAMHACGHDGHVAMLLGAARLLTDNKDQLSGKVRFMFQPGEEGFHGARNMIEEGVLDGVDHAYALHLITTMPSGQFYTRGGALMASADRFEVTVSGKGGHASAPHECVDPIPAAAEIITGVHTMVGRTMNVAEPGVVTVGQVLAGSTNNVIPETAYLQGTIRAVSEDTRSAFHEGIQRVTTNVAAAHRCSCLTHIEPGYPVTVNNAESVEVASAVAEDTFGEGSMTIMATPIMGAEDFSYVLNQVPGAMVFLGAAPPDVDDPSHAAPNHSNYMRIDEAALTRGVAMYSALALVHTDASL